MTSFQFILDVIYDIIWHNKYKKYNLHGVEFGNVIIHLTGAINFPNNNLPNSIVGFNSVTTYLFFFFVLLTMNHVKLYFNCSFFLNYKKIEVIQPI